MKKEAKKSKKYGLVIFLVLILAIIIIIVFSLTGRKYSQSSIDQFAECLTKNGAVMYGAFWCPHCAATKKRFGASFSYIKYIECDPRGENQQAELCIDKKIDKYDTWEFADGSRIISEPTFSELSSKTGCSAPGVLS